MAHYVEPMDVDSSICDFDNKENSLHHNNVLAKGNCTEKGYEELEVSELNMKLRYSITPTSSPMSKSFTANCLDNKQLEAGDNNINNDENANLTRSMNSTITRTDSIKKALPLQSFDKFSDGNRNPLQPVDHTVGLEKDVTITVSGPNDLDEDLSIPSSSSSLAHTPEATTPTKEFNKNEGGSPIMRGLKSVLSMFRPSQSPITTSEVDNLTTIVKPEALSPPVINSPNTSDSTPSTMLVSTPLAAQKTALSKREASNRDSVVFKDDLENELEWKDDSTVIFSNEKIPIHKLFMTQNKPVMSKSSEVKETDAAEKLDSTVEYMDISYNDVIMQEKTDTEEINNKNNITNVTESDSEFLDCETTFTKSENKNDVSLDMKQKDGVNEGLNMTVTNVSLNGTLSKTDVSLSSEKDITPVIEEKIDLAKEEITNNQVTSEPPASLSQPEREPPLVFKLTGQDLEFNEGNHVVQNTTDTLSVDSSIVVSSLSQIPLIADPRVLLFNIPDKNPDRAVTNNKDLNTTPADIPLPDDEDLEKVEVNEETGKDNPTQLVGKIQCTEEVPVNIVENKSEEQHEQKEVTELENESTNEKKAIETIIPYNTNKIENLRELDQVEHDTLKLFVVDEVASIHEDDPQNVIYLETTNDKSLTSDNNEHVDMYEGSPLKETKQKSSSTIENESRGICIQNEIKDVTKSNFTEQNAVEIIPPKLEVKGQNVQEQQSANEKIGISHKTAHDTIILFESADNEKNTGTDKKVYEHSGNNNFIQDIGIELSSAASANDSFLKKDIQQEKETCKENFISTEAIKEINQFQDKVADGVSENMKDSVIESPIFNTIKQEELLAQKSIESLPEAFSVEANIEEDAEELIIASKDNSPFVTISADDLEGSPKSQENDNFENLDNPDGKNDTNISPPLSPKIVSKGYNLNFDEIDDPFATKTKIRLSPSRDGSPNESFENVEIKPNKVRSEMIKNRRKSQPTRKRPADNKKMNSTFSGSYHTSIDHHESYQDKVIPKETKTMCMATPKMIEIPVEKAACEQKPVADDLPSEDFKILTTSKDFEESVNAIQDPQVKKQDDKTSSTELSTYQSIASSCEGRQYKSVFNLPEIDDSKFNSFVKKSNVCHSPCQSLQTDDPFATKNKIMPSPVPNETSEGTENENATIKDHKEINQQSTFDTKCPVVEEQNLSNDASNTTCSSKATDDKDATVREVHTEDEDTIEGPFLEADGINHEDKMSDFGGENLNNMMQFSEFPTQQSENQETGELFIDAEAFEFLLNQNKANEVADSGKESLFLKFDPLYAKRMSSDGVVAALNRVQKKKQSTPKKISDFPINDVTFDKSPVAGASGINVTQESDTHNVTEDSTEDLNITVAKPMMVVNPAINPVPAPRNKTITPVRSNRQSLTFTSPAIAVIDRLLSMSANNSFIGHEVTVTESRGHNEADLALTQLRELLADKEISVYNLKSESKELKERLRTLESQMKNLEEQSKERLKKINDLSEKLTEKTKLNKSMASVVEEYERTIASLISETEQERKRHAEERLQLINERDEQTRHLASMEVSFSDLHSKYEKSKQVIYGFKTNEDSLKKNIQDFEENLAKAQTNYELLKQHATSKLNHANEELQKMNRAHETEVLKLNAMIKRQELHITSLEETLLQKTKANEELTAICDELINRVG